MSNMPIIAASILAANPLKLGEEITHAVESGAQWIHVDVMDNHFVPNLTFGPHIVKEICKNNRIAIIDVHLMIKPVESMIIPFAEAGADYITFHVDAVSNIRDTIQLIRAQGCRPGVVFNPNIPIGNLAEYIAEIDMVLVMSVYAGFGGQSFMPETLEKVRAIRAIIEEQQLSTRLEIDGGINNETIKSAADAGADTFVIGSALFKHKPYDETIARFYANLRQGFA